MNKIIHNVLLLALIVATSGVLYASWNLWRKLK